MNKYIVTFVCGDTTNIPTYDIIDCEEDDLTNELDRYYGSWRTNSFIKVFQVSKEIDKEEPWEDYV